jgi:hypothetical protein
MSTKLCMVALVATISALALLLVPVEADAFLGTPSVSFLTRRQANFDTILLARGGAISVEVEDDEDEMEIESSDEEEEEEEDEEEEEEELNPKLVKSAISAASKAKANAATAVKATVSSTLQATSAASKAKAKAAAVVKATVSATVPKKKKKSSLLKLFRIPYILKACLNPFVLIQMTKGYFASLVNLNYLSDNVVSRSSRVEVSIESRVLFLDGNTHSDLFFSLLSLL